MERFKRSTWRTNAGTVSQSISVGRPTFGRSFSGMTTGCEFSSEESVAPSFSLNSTKTDSAEACEKLCLQSSEFTCRSYTFTPSTGLCSFGPDDAFSVGRLDENRTSNGIERKAHFQRNECTNGKTIIFVRTRRSQDSLLQCKLRVAWTKWWPVSERIELSTEG